MIIDILTRIIIDPSDPSIKADQVVYLLTKKNPCRHVKSRYILVDRWDELITEVVSDDGLNYAAVGAATFKHIFENFTHNENAKIQRLLNNSCHSVKIRGKILRKKNQRPDLVRNFFKKHKSKSENYKRWSNKNKTKLKEKQNKWRSKNSDRIREYNRAYYQQRRIKDINFRIKGNLRNRTRLALTKGKLHTTMDLVGCSIEQLRKHIENLFDENMNWQNYGRGGWEIDHIIPCASFDLTKEEEQRKCFHYTNLQPLWGVDNRIKKDKMPPSTPD